jgi:aldose 1-epimerase
MELRNNTTGAFVTILPEIGASLHQVCLACSNSLHPLLWAVKDDDELYKEGISQYRGALLFPFVDRIENGKYAFEKIEYILPCNEANHRNALHGFLNSKPFQILHSRADEEQASVSFFFDYDGLLQGFPFPCTVTTVYTLKNCGFSCDTSVQSKSRGGMPVGIGWHPYFLITDDHSQFEINIPAIASFRTREDNVNTGVQEPFYDRDKFLNINNFSFNVYALNQFNNEAQTILRNKKKKIDIVLTTIGYPFLQVFVVAGRGIAIEPLTCIGNAFNNGVGLTILSPDAIMKNSFEVKLKAAE